MINNIENNFYQLYSEIETAKNAFDSTASQTHLTSEKMNVIQGQFAHVQDGLNRVMELEKKIRLLSLDEVYQQEFKNEYEPDEMTRRIQYFSFIEFAKQQKDEVLGQIGLLKKHTLQWLDRSKISTGLLPMSSTHRTDLQAPQQGPVNREELRMPHLSSQFVRLLVLPLHLLTQAIRYLMELNRLSAPVISQQIILQRNEEEKPLPEQPISSMLEERPPFEQKEAIAKSPSSEQLISDYPQQEAPKLEAIQPNPFLELKERLARKTSKPPLPPRSPKKELKDSLPIIKAPQENKESVHLVEDPVQVNSQAPQLQPFLAADQEAKQTPSPKIEVTHSFSEQLISKDPQQEAPKLEAIQQRPLPDLKGRLTHKAFKPPLPPRSPKKELKDSLPTGMQVPQENKERVRLVEDPVQMNSLAPQLPPFLAADHIKSSSLPTEQPLPQINLNEIRAETKETVQETLQKINKPEEEPKKPGLERGDLLSSIHQFNKNRLKSAKTEKKESKPAEQPLPQINLNESKEETKETSQIELLQTARKIDESLQNIPSFIPVPPPRPQVLIQPSVQTAVKEKTTSVTLSQPKPSFMDFLSSSMQARRSAYLNGDEEDDVNETSPEQSPIDPQFNSDNLFPIKESSQEVVQKTLKAVDKSDVVERPALDTSDLLSSITQFNKSSLKSVKVEKKKTEPQQVENSLLST